MIPPHRTVTVLLVVGMKSPQCRQVVIEALEAVPGVLDVEVNLFRARASISHNNICTTSDLIRAVEGAGYAATHHVSRRRGIT